MSAHVSFQRPRPLPVRAAAFCGSVGLWAAPWGSEDSSPDRSRAGALSEPAQSAATSPFVLVIDDDHDIRRALAMVLEDEGIDSVVAANGAEALEMLADLRPDLIILDLMMPVMNGFEFRKAQLMNPQLADIPTVVLSAASDAGARLAELGIDQVLRKPIDLGAVLDAVARNVPGWDPKD